MDEKLTIEYDTVGDVLYVSKVPPYPQQRSTELDHGIVARLHPTTGEVENLEILFFKQRAAEGEVSVPIHADLKLIPAA